NEGKSAAEVGPRSTSDTKHTRPRLEPQLMQNNAIVKKLNEILAHEWTGVAQYAQQGFMVRGLWRESYAGFFMDGAEESFGHAKKIGEKIVALGGIPTIERNKIRQSDDLRAMLEQALEFERMAVRHYAEALELAEDDRPLVV